MSCWITFRNFHTSRNWLKVQADLNLEEKRSYSSAQTIFSCLMPICCIIMFSIIFGSNFNQDDEYNIFLKDAKPHFRPSDAYYNYMYQDIHFNFNYLSLTPQDNNASNKANLTLHQYYAAHFAGNSQLWDCRKHLEENPKYVSLTHIDTAFATLCYYDNYQPNGKNPGEYMEGLVLCRNDNFDENIEIEISYDDGPGNGIYRFKWNTVSSYIITLKLWIGYEGTDEGYDTSNWIGNQVEVESVEYDVNKQIVPYTKYDTDCYGIRVRMSRNVYVTKGGLDPSATILSLFALIGATYSFCRLFCGLSGIGCNYCCQCCCKQFYEKDLQPFIGNEEKKIKKIIDDKIEMEEMQTN